MTYDLEQPLAPQVDLEMARLLWRRMGHTTNPERERRIALDARDIINQGFPAAFAFPEAYSLELLLYGDPDCQNRIVGLLPTR